MARLCVVADAAPPCCRARAQFPYFVASLFTTARLGMSARQAAAALTIANYVGGTVGSSATLLFNAFPYKGRAVCLATLAYGAFAAVIGCSSLLPVGMAAVCLCGAFDAIGCAAPGLEPSTTKPSVLPGSTPRLCCTG